MIYTFFVIRFTFLNAIYLIPHQHSRFQLFLFSVGAGDPRFRCESSFAGEYGGILYGELQRGGELDGGGAGGVVGEDFCF